MIENSADGRFKKTDWRQMAGTNGDESLQVAQLFKGSFLAGIFFSTLGIFLDFPGFFSVLNAAFFLETWPLPL